MKTPVWTKSDAKRSEKMGWKLGYQEAWCASRGINTGDKFHRILRHGDRFKSDDEAIEWVVDSVSRGCMGSCGIAEWDTCRKALFLCAKG